MKTTIVLFILISSSFLLNSCNKCDNSKPGYPHGRPDDESHYVSGGYESWDYTYWCHGGKYKSYTYSKLDNDCYWEESLFTSSGINC